MRLPEKIRRALERIVKRMKGEENVYGVGLFGSWSRGDAEESSDVDLLILDKRDLSHGFVERRETTGLLIDFDHVPKRWINGPMPSQIDQKIHELQIFYDRDWSLTNTKLLMANSYSSPERVDIRTEAHIIDSDIYMSRATSAFSREDFQSAQLFAAIALESVLKVLIEIALEPFSSSRFIQKTEECARRLNRPNLFQKYLEISRLNTINNANIKGELKLLDSIWNEASFTTKQNLQSLEASHFRVKTKLKYHLIPAFLKGVKMRARSLIDSGRLIEAKHYLNATLVDMVENYACLKSSVDNVKIDYTTLMRSLKSLEKKNPKNYENIVSFLDLRDISKPDVARILEKTRKTILKTRKERKILIKNHLLTSRAKTDS